MNQVITIDPNGSISGLQRKRGKGLDLRQFGRARIERASEITWDEERQNWNIHVLSRNVCRWMTEMDADGPRFYTRGGVTLDFNHWSMAIENCELPDTALYDQDFLAFDHYDDAVAVEVKFLDALRARGVF